MHAGTSGLAHFLHDDERTCPDEVRYLLSLLPSNNQEHPPEEDTEDPADRPCDALLEMVPADGRQPYGMRNVIAEIVDDGDYLEVHESWAGTVICAMARIAGHAVGIVANQPLTMAGVLDIPASEKAARFVSTCDTGGSSGTGPSCCTRTATLRCRGSR